MRAIPAHLSLPAFYAALFSAYGVYMPFMPVWLAARGLGPEEIAACLAIPMLVRLIVPFWGLLADRLSDMRLVIGGVLAAAFCAGSLLNLTQGFWPILGLMLLLNLFWTPALPLTDSMALQACEANRIDYGRVRLWGSFSFMLAAALAGMVLDWLSPVHILALILALISLGAVASRMLPTDSRAQGGEPVRLSGLLRLARDGELLRMFCAAGLVQASHGMFYVLGSVHWRAQGLSSGLIGWLWATGVIAETVLFAFSARLIGNASARRLILIGGSIASIRWVLFVAEMPGWLLFAVQVLHAGSFALTHIGTMRFIREHVPARLAATGQGLFTALSAGMMMGLSMLVSGPLYAHFGKAAWLGMAVVALAGVFLAAISPKAQWAAAA